jgi:hypothetical protein
MASNSANAISSALYNDVPPVEVVGGAPEPAPAVMQGTMKSGGILDGDESGELQGSAIESRCGARAEPAIACFAATPRVTPSHT